MGLSPQSPLIMANPARFRPAISGLPRITAFGDFLDELGNQISKNENTSCNVLVRRNGDEVRVVLTEILPHHTWANESDVDLLNQRFYFLDLPNDYPDRIRRAFRANERRQFDPEEVQSFYVFTFVEAEIPTVVAPDCVRDAYLEEFTPFEIFFWMGSHLYSISEDDVNNPHAEVTLVI